MGRRLFVGDLHGCLAELDALLGVFGFKAGVDRLFSVGDVVGKGPHVPGTLRRLQELHATVVVGNHDEYLLKASATPETERTPREREYLDMLGPEREALIAYMRSWPAFVELGDIYMVHAGLEPGKKNLREMARNILVKIRTWDGMGMELNRAGDPPWYECVTPEKVVVFGHWAAKGLIDLPLFKGLDTGCVYGRRLTGWCPEEGRFHQVDALREYSPVHKHD